MRKIDINGKIWEYTIGKCNVVARSGDEKRVADFPTVTGWDWDSIERGEWKRYFSITPKQVGDWLRKIDV